MGGIPKYTNALATLGSLAAKDAPKSEQQKRRETYISDLAERLRATPDIDLSYIAAWAIQELVEVSVNAEELGRELVVLAEERATDSNRMCAAYEEFFDLLESPSLRGYLNVKAKLAKDPVQDAKAEAKELWQERYEGKHPKLRTNEQFATECLRRWRVLTSIGTVTNWCTEWNNEAKQKSRC